MKPQPLATAHDLANTRPLQPVRRVEVTILGMVVPTFITSDETEMRLYIGRQRDSTRVDADIRLMPRKIMLDRGSQS
jgi:hypothetical protein